MKYYLVIKTRQGVSVEKELPTTAQVPAKDAEGKPVRAENGAIIFETVNLPLPDYRGTARAFSGEQPPTKSQMEALFAPDYAELRRRAYPAVGDQFDMLWHAMDNGTVAKSEPFYSKLKAVKDAYSKS